jgi:indole-3-glycerol phosphate synthase
MTTTPSASVDELFDRVFLSEATHIVGQAYDAIHELARADGFTLTAEETTSLLTTIRAKAIAALGPAIQEVLKRSPSGATAAIAADPAKAAAEYVDHAIALLPVTTDHRQMRC